MCSGAEIGGGDGGGGGGGYCGSEAGKCFWDELSSGVDGRSEDSWVVAGGGG